jgi:hypothetical protein
VSYPGIARPTTDFQAVRDGRRSTPLYYTIDLSTARSIAAGTMAIVDIQGNSFYADPLQDALGATAAGYATVHFQDANLNPQGTPMLVGPQFIANVPFTRILVENIAQPGKFLRIIYGVDIDFSPGLNASVAINGTVNTNEIGISWASSYRSTTAMGANTPDSVFSAAANANGGTLWAAQFENVNAGIANLYAAYLMKAAAPATVIDGDVLVQGQGNFTIGAANSVLFGTLARAVRFASGKRLDYISTTAEANAHRSALYTL